MSDSRDSQANGVVDVAIVGGGPAGLFAAFYAGLRGMSVKIVDSMPELGGQLTALYPEKNIYDVAGFPEVSAKELVQRCARQAESARPAICLERRVVDLQPDREAPGGWVLVTDPPERHRARTVIIAAGLGAFAPRKLPVPESERWEGRGLYYGVSNRAEFCGKDVLVVGGGDSAVDWALMLAGEARSVTLIHRRDGFRAHEESVAKLKASPADVKVFYELRAIHGNSHVEAVTVEDNRTGAREELRVDAIIASIGYLSSLGPIAQWGLELEGKGIRVNQRMETNLAGVYAIGDIAVYPGKVKLIAVGFGEAPIAVSHAKLRVDPSARLQPEHSSDMKRS